MMGSRRKLALSKQRHSAVRLLLAMTAALAAAPHARATQHLVDAGNPWDDVVERARPGDEILLLPGAHQSATLKNLAGTAESPIIIRGLDPNNPPSLAGHRVALTLLNPRHVIVENLVFERSALTAIIVAAEPNAAPAVDGESAPAPRNVTLRNLRIARTGPDDDARSVIINRMRDVRIESCSFDGWTGRAIEIIGASRAIVRDCRFTRAPQYNAELAIAMREGTRDSSIVDCHFNQAGGTAAISIGGKSNVEQLILRSEDSSSDASLYEAMDCRVSNCVFIDQPCPVMLSHTDRCSVRQCTFVRPRRWVLALLSVHEDQRVALSNRPVFSSNLVSWTGGDLTGLVLVDAHTRNVKMVLESNLWWSDEPTAVRRRMIPTIVEEAWPQEVDIDPRLDENYRPANDDASMYGAKRR